MDWAKYPNFRKEEFKCKHTGECNMHADLLEILQSIRDELKKPIFISSGFRSIRHPIEQEKPNRGEHTYGMAVDIICQGQQAIDIIELAIKHGIKRIGVHQKGNPNGRFVHIGIADRYKPEFPKSIWTY